MAHAPTGWSGLARDESDYRFADIFFDVVGCLVFGCTANFADHADGFGATVLLKKLQRINKLRADNWVAADPYTGGLTVAQGGQLPNRFVGEGAAPGNNTHVPLFMNMGRHDADLAFPRRDNSRTVGPDQA